MAQQRISFRKAKLLEAATSEFLRRGYAGTSVSSIIALAGGSRSSVYEMFGGKEGLFIAVVERSMTQRIEVLDELDRSPMPLKEALFKFGVIVCRLLLSSDVLRLFRTLMGIVDRLPEAGGLVFERGWKPLEDRLKTFLMSRAKEETLEITDAECSARLFLVLIQADMHTRALLYPDWRPTEEDIHNNVEFAVRVFLNEVRPSGFTRETRHLTTTSPKPIGSLKAGAIRRRKVIPPRRSLWPV